MRLKEEQERRELEERLERERLAVMAREQEIQKAKRKAEKKRIADELAAAEAIKA